MSVGAEVVEQGVQSGPPTNSLLGHGARLACEGLPRVLRSPTCRHHLVDATLDLEEDTARQADHRP